MRFIKHPNEDFVRLIVEKNRIHNYPDELGSNVPQVKINMEYIEIQRARQFLDVLEAEHFNNKNKRIPDPFEQSKLQKEKCL